MAKIEDVVNHVKQKGEKGINSGPGRHLKNIITNFNQDHCLVHSGSLAYVTILSLVPLVIVSFSLYSAFGTFAHTKETILNYLLQYLVPQSAQSVVGYINHFAEKSKTLGITGMVALLGLSFSLLSASEEAFNEIWKVPKKRSVLNRLFVFANFIVWMPVLMGFAIFLSTKAVLIPYMSTVLKLALLVLPFILAFLGFTTSYVIIPSGKVNLKSAAIGGAVASFLWTAGKHVFDIIVANTFSFKAFSALYGSLVILPIFLIWIYTCWVITLIGAEIASYHQLPISRDVEGIKTGFLCAASILTLAAKRFLKGEPLVSQSEVLMRWPLSQGIVERLVENNLLVRAEEGGFVISRPPEQIDITEVLGLFSDPEQLGVLYQKVLDTFEGLTLRDLVENGQ